LSQSDKIVFNEKSKISSSTDSIVLN